MYGKIAELDEGERDGVIGLELVVAPMTWTGEAPSKSRFLKRRCR